MNALQSLPGADPLAYRTRDAARVVGISERFLRQLVATGAIRPAKVGRCCVFTRDELERFLAAAMTPAAAPLTTKAEQARPTWVSNSTSRPHGE